MRKITAFLILVAFAALPLVGRAEIREQSFSLSPFIGGYTFDGGQDLETKPVYGLRAGYNLTKNWGLEALFDYVNTDLKDNGGSVGVYRYGLDALYHFMPEGKLVPYLVAGAGAMTINGPAGMDDGDGTDPAVNAGLGLKYFLSENWAIRGDVRDVVMFGSVRNNIEYTVGISYLFGGEEAKPVVREAAPVREEAAPVREEVAPVQEEVAPVQE